MPAIDTKMKILIYSLNFSPELTGIGKYSGEMANWLSAQGHDVHVVTAPPYYPDWVVGHGYSSRCYALENQNGIAVYRCPLWIPKKLSGLKRLLHLASFALSSLPIMIKHVFWKPDIVWVVAPAFFTVPTAWMTAKLSGAASWVHIQDYEVDAAFDLGILKGDWLKRSVVGLESYVLRSFDVVSTISNRMLDRALLKGVDKQKLVLFPNWVDISALQPSQKSKAYRTELNIPEAAIVALYSGNMGAKQGLEILAEAAKLLSSQSDLYFIFCGNGSGRDDLASRVAILANVRIIDLQPFERYAELMTTADIHLLPQRADAADLVMPSKLTGMLASGRPIVATAHEGTEISLVLSECGLISPPENAVAFANAVSFLSANPESRASMGGAARAYAEKYLDKQAVLKQFEAKVIEIRPLRQNAN